MAQQPYAYDKHEPEVQGPWRLRLGIGLLVASLILISMVLWQLRVKKTPTDEPDGSARRVVPSQW